VSIIFVATSIRQKVASVGMADFGLLCGWKLQTASFLIIKRLIYGRVGTFCTVLALNSNLTPLSDTLLFQHGSDSAAPSPFQDGQVLDSFGGGGGGRDGCRGSGVYCSAHDTAEDLV
jgi:hypothetical protein